MAYSSNMYIFRRKLLSPQVYRVLLNAGLVLVVIVLVIFLSVLYYETGWDLFALLGI